MAWIIFLHGASSSGKSTLAKALQKHADTPFWHISIDHLRDGGVLPIDRFRSGEFNWPSSRSAIFDGFHRSVQAYADAGHNLILEHILDTEGWLETLQDLLRPHDVLFVGVHCAIPELRRRELVRDDRKSGSAEQDQRTIHIGRTYDLEVESENGAEANANTILTALSGGKRVSDFSNTGG